VPKEWFEWRKAKRLQLTFVCNYAPGCPGLAPLAVAEAGYEYTFGKPLRLNLTMQDRMKFVKLAALAFMNRFPEYERRQKTPGPS
jgi:hypothetical protein